jgi:heme A synthase
MFRYVVMLLLSTLSLIVLGASVTREVQPIPGLSARLDFLAEPTLIWLQQAHIFMAWVVGGLTLGLSGWLQWRVRRAWPRLLALAALLIVGLEGWLGMQGVHSSLPPVAAFFHASLAPVLLSILVAIAADVSAQKVLLKSLKDPGRPSFRSLTVVVSLLALLQVLLGAAYRYGLLGVLTHILNALVITLMVLVVSIPVIREFPGHRSLRPAALGLAVVTAVQVSFGFGTFIVLLIGPGSSTTLSILSVAHAATGALVLAAGVLLTIQVWQNLYSPNLRT